MKIRKAWLRTILLIIFIIIVSMATYYSIKCGYALGGSIDAWVGFAGSILGGRITMFALFLTFRHERSVTEANNALGIRPCLIGEFTCYDSDSKELVIPNCINNYGFICWKINNITGNLANHVTISDKYSLVKNNSNKYSPIDSAVLEERFGVLIYTILMEDHIAIKPHGEQAYKTNFYITEGDRSEYKFQDSAFMFKHVIVFQYSDITNQQFYKTKFESEININVNVDNHLHFFLWSTGNTLQDT